MNKALKTILVIINIAMLVIAVRWYLDKKELEPIVVCLGEVAAILGLLFEGAATKIITKNVKNSSDVIVEARHGDNIETSDIDGSKVNINTK